VHVVVEVNADHFCCDGAQRCAASGESSCVFAELIYVGYKAWPLILSVGALVSGTDDAP
jgi:hypothetical protein